MATADGVVVDASAFVDLLLGGELGAAVARRLVGTARHAPAHVDAEILSSLGRWHRAGRLSAEATMERLRATSTMPLIRHPLPELLAGAWSRRENMGLADGLYVELATRLGVPLVTTDQRLARATTAEAIGL